MSDASPPPKDESLAQTRALTLAAGAAVLVVIAAQLYHASRYWLAVDDAFIAFRYAENLVAGKGLVFNVGERVEGYTDFLWVVLVAIFHALGVASVTAGKLLGALGSAATVALLYVVGRRYGLGRWGALAPCAAVAASASLALWTGGGLETTFYMALFSAALASAIEQLESDERRGWRSGVLFALAALTRPEAAGLFFVVLGYAALRRRWPFALRAIGGFAVLVVPHTIFRLVYYGALLPNTFYAKTGLSGEAVAEGASYLHRFLIDNGLYWALLALAGLAINHRAWRERGRVIIPALLCLLAATAYVVLVGGDFMLHSRFLVPYLPWAVLLCCVGAAQLGERVAKPRPKLRWLPAALCLLVATSIAWPAYRFAGQRYSDKIESFLINTQMYRQFGQWLARNIPRGALVAGSAMGRVPYYSGLKTIDMLGLTDAHIARAPLDPRARGAIAHRRYDVDYILGRKPHIVTLEFGITRHEFNPRTDVNTRKLWSLLTGRWGAWPAVTELIKRREFRLRYAPRAAEVKRGAYCFYYQRDDTLLRMRKATPLTSTDARALFQLALRYRMQGFLAESIAALRRVAELAPTNLRPQLNIGFFYFEARELQKSLAEFQSLEKRFPTAPEVQYWLGLVLKRLGRHTEARKHLMRFLRRVPSGPFAQRARAMLAQ